MGSDGLRPLYGVIGGARSVDTIYQPAQTTALGVGEYVFQAILLRCCERGKANRSVVAHVAKWHDHVEARIFSCCYGMHSLKRSRGLVGAFKTSLRSMPRGR